MYVGGVCMRLSLRPKYRCGPLTSVKTLLPNKHKLIMIPMCDANIMDVTLRSSSTAASSFLGP